MTPTPLRELDLPAGTPEPDSGNDAAAPEQPAASPQSVTVPPTSRSFPPPADIPTQEGKLGARFDFNDGCRVTVPEQGKRWRIRLLDLDTGNILFQTELLAGRVNSSKRYFIRFRVEIWADDEPILNHDFDAKDREVLIQFPVGTIGDTLGWFPYAVKFQKIHQCRLTCAMAERLIPLFRDAYPESTSSPMRRSKHPSAITRPTASACSSTTRTVFTTDRLPPCRAAPHRGLHPRCRSDGGAPQIALPDDTPPIAEPYVCIAVQSTTQCKYWNNPAGWLEIVRFLKDAGYRVVCIDQKPVHGAGLVWNHIPHGAEDETGDRPLAERARWLRHAEFFVGLSSGLSWLAWAAGAPGGDDQRLHPSDQRVRDAVSGDQLARLQQLLERPARPVRPQGFPLVPAPRGHAAAVRMHAADHRRTGEGGHTDGSGIWRTHIGTESLILKANDAVRIAPQRRRVCPASVAAK